MGVLTLLQIRTEVDSSMGNKTSVLDSRLDTWVNLAYNEIASGIDFEELSDDFDIPTVIGTHEYTGPANPLAVQLVRDETNERLLTWVPKNEYFRLNRSQTGAVLRWTRRGDNILVYPTPDAVVTLRALFKITPPALALDTDVTVLPPYIDNALIFLAVAYGLLATGEDARAITWANRAVNYLSSRLTNQDFSFILGGLLQTQPSREVASGTA